MARTHNKVSLITTQGRKKKALAIMTKHKHPATVAPETSPTLDIHSAFSRHNLGMMDLATTLRSGMASGTQIKIKKLEQEARNVIFRRGILITALASVLFSLAITLIYTTTDKKRMGSVLSSALDQLNLGWQIAVIFCSRFFMNQSNTRIEEYTLARLKNEGVKDTLSQIYAAEHSQLSLLDSRKMRADLMLQRKLSVASTVLAQIKNSRHLSGTHREYIQISRAFRREVKNTFIQYYKNHDVLSNAINTTLHASLLNLAVLFAVTFTNGRFSDHLKNPAKILAIIAVTFLAELFGILSVYKLKNTAFFARACNWFGHAQGWIEHKRITYDIPTVDEDNLSNPLTATTHLLADIETPYLGKTLQHPLRMGDDDGDGDDIEMGDDPSKRRGQQRVPAGSPQAPWTLSSHSLDNQHRTGSPEGRRATTGHGKSPGGTTVNNRSPGDRLLEGPRIGYAGGKRLLFS